MITSNKHICSLSKDNQEMPPLTLVRGSLSWSLVQGARRKGWKGRPRLLPSRLSAVSSERPGMRSSPFPARAYVATMTCTRAWSPSEPTEGKGPKNTYFYVLTHGAAGAKIDFWLRVDSKEGLMDGGTARACSASRAARDRAHLER
jgi:hypothetical protein